MGVVSTLDRSRFNSEMKLLIVDDEVMVREAVADVVEDDFEVILHAGDGIEGIELACSERPDLILLDMTMPRLGGLEACARLREAPEVKGVPIVVLTGRKTEEEARAAFEAGADDYMVKPFAIGQLRARLRTLALGRLTTPDSSPGDDTASPGTRSPG